MDWRRTVVNLYHNVFNWKLAAMSAMTNGLIAMLANSNHSPGEYFSAGIGSAIVGFFSTGITGRVVQHFSAVKPEIKSYFLGSVIPAAMTCAGYLLVHWWINTPELFLTVAYPVLLSFGTSFITNLATKSNNRWLKLLFRPENYPDNHQ